MEETMGYPIRQGRVVLHEPLVVTDGGPWATHDMACAVCRAEKAVLELNTSIFHPCWRCQADGWSLTMRPWWRRRFRRA